MTDKVPRGQTPERKAYMKAWHKANDRRAYKAAYKAEHKEQDSAYRKNNAEKIKAQKRDYYLENREKILAKVKVRSELNKENILAYQAEYYKENTDKIKTRVSKWQSENPNKVSHYATKRRARKFSNGGSHTLDELIVKFNSLGNVCYYCGKEGKLTIDHDIPLSRGGADSIDNILPACRSCNSKKSAKTANEYLFGTNHTKIGGVGEKPYEGR